MPDEERDDWRRFNAERAAVRRVGELTGDGMIAIEGPVTFAIWVGAMIASMVLDIALRKPEINSELGQLRIGRRILDFSRIEVAHLVVRGRRKSRDLELNFGPARGPRLIVQLTSKQLRVLDPHAARALAGMFERSSLWSKDDAGPAAARSGLSRQQAHDVVLTPPLPGDSLPNPAS